MLQRKLINGIFGYRTLAATKNESNWIFTNLRCAKLVLIASFINLSFGMFLSLLFTLKILVYNEFYLYFIGLQILISFIFIIMDIQIRLKDRKE